MYNHGAGNKMPMKFFTGFNPTHWHSVLESTRNPAIITEEPVQSGSINPVDGKPFPWIQQNLTVTYIDRQNTARRLSSKSHSKLVEALGAIPDIIFVHAHMETMTLGEQLELDRRTDLLIGVHGNGLTHSIFMQPNRFTVELYPKGVLLMANKQLAAVTTGWSSHVT